MATTSRRQTGPPTVGRGGALGHASRALDMLGRQVDYWLTVYRRTWRGSAVLSFLQPVLYLAAMGFLLGSYVDAGGAGLAGAPSYLSFVAPGLLAATAMQVAASEVMWPVMGALKWNKTYLGMIASPLGVADIARAHLGYAMFRVALSSAVFVVVLVVAGVVPGVTAAVAALAAALLTGLGVAVPIYGYSVGASSEQAFAMIFRLGVMPMFLFSGAFFPLGDLPDPVRWAAMLSPLFHGVELCRHSTLQTWGWGDLVHVGYLVLLAVAGFAWAVRRLERRLLR